MAGSRGWGKRRSSLPLPPPPPGSSSRSLIRRCLCVGCAPRGGAARPTPTCGVPPPCPPPTRAGTASLWSGRNGFPHPTVYSGASTRTSPLPSFPPHPLLHQTVRCYPAGRPLRVGRAPTPPHPHPHPATPPITPGCLPLFCSFFFFFFPAVEALSVDRPDPPRPAPPAPCHPPPIPPPPIPLAPPVAPNQRRMVRRRCAAALGAEFVAALRAAGRACAECVADVDRLGCTLFFSNPAPVGCACSGVGVRTPSDPPQGGRRSPSQVWGAGLPPVYWALVCRWARAFPWAATAPPAARA